MRGEKKREVEGGRLGVAGLPLGSSLREELYVDELSVAVG